MPGRARQPGGGDRHRSGRVAVSKPADNPPAPAAGAAEALGEIETRSRILDAAMECFAHFGNDKTTVNDVARAAGVSRQTVYRYFSGRTALLEAVDESEHERRRADAQRLASETIGIEAFIAGLAAREAANVNRYRTREHLIRHDRGLFNSLFLSQERTIERFKDVVRPRLAKAVAQGELSRRLDQDEAVEWVAIVLASMGRLTRATTFDIDDPHQVGQFVARHICHGLLAR